MLLHRIYTRMRANKIKNRVQINVFNIPILSYAKFSIWWSFWYDHWVEKSEPLAGVLGVFSHWFEIIFIRMFYAMNVSQIHNIVVYSSKHRFINIWDRKISYIHWGYYFRSAFVWPHYDFGMNVIFYTNISNEKR